MFSSTPLRTTSPATESVSERMSEWVSGWVNERVNDWMSEWGNEWVSEWITYSIICWDIYHRVGSSYFTPQFVCFFIKQEKRAPDHITSHHIISYRIILYYNIPHQIISYHITSYHLSACSRSWHSLRRKWNRVSNSFDFLIVSALLVSFK